MKMMVVVVIGSLMFKDGGWTASQLTITTSMISDGSGTGSVRELLLLFLLLLRLLPKFWFGAHVVCLPHINGWMTALLAVLDIE